jgi:hypothetical protein
MKNFNITERVSLAWNEANEIQADLDDLSDDEIIEIRAEILQRSKKIQELLNPFVSEEIVNNL